ncbi:carboxymuconolactone decarboxylase family protein [Desulfovibrio ferrophilus]|uniref:Carboxymuconolactone decarboxylase n=1 Tax=Desulfovibrio ferrophilus TaxID=241368 RepID=A0A2Z6AZQ5_9BACT|nr:hypothetical protein [Desulfovibrio ferrophilus]BBD08698.1 uncharacterized protein DFE_1972 [Desulfovibrio ferrophilus]
MFAIEHMSPEQATGTVAEIYGLFPEEIGVPVPLQLLSASPHLLEVHGGFIRYYKNHKTLGFPLLPALRYLVASREGYEYCIDFNGGMLKRHGMSADELQAIATNPAQLPLEPKDVAMLEFVTKSLDAPSEIGEADVDILKEHGWAESDALDALIHASLMFAYGAAFRAFSK